jgi:hypothetical protein
MQRQQQHQQAQHGSSASGRALAGAGLLRQSSQQQVTAQGPHLLQQLLLLAMAMLGHQPSAVLR